MNALQASALILLRLLFQAPARGQSAESGIPFCEGNASEAAFGGQRMLVAKIKGIASLRCPTAAIHSAFGFRVYC